MDARYGYRLPLYSRKQPALHFGKGGEEVSHFLWEEARMVLEDSLCTTALLEDWPGMLS